MEEALSKRRSVREYQEVPLSLEEVGQLLWAGQGVTDSRGLRTAPSAGGLYPLELSVVVGDVAGLEAGVYRYVPARHALTQELAGDVREALAQAAYDQEWVADARAVIVVSGVYERTRPKYGARAEQFVHMEAGHVGQSIALQATGLGLGTVTVGGFDPSRVQALLMLAGEELPLYLLPVGRPAGAYPRE